ESHLVGMHRMIEAFMPHAVVVDPITNLISAGDTLAVKSMLTRLIDFLKTKHVTAIFTNLSTKSNLDSTNTEVSSKMDTGVQVRDVQSGRWRKRLISVLKSRGMEHATDAREFLIGNQGIQIVPAQPASAGTAAD